MVVTKKRYDYSKKEGDRVENDNIKQHELKRINK